MQFNASVREHVLTQALGAGDSADAFYERRVTRSFRLQDGRIHEAGIAVTCGVGIRVVCGERAGYAASEDLSETALLETARVASLIAKSGPGRSRVVPVPAAPERAPEIARPATRVLEAGSATYVDLLARADVAARAYDPRVQAVNAFVTDEHQEVTIATSEGLFVRDVRPLVTLGVQCVARGKERGSAFFGDGGRTSVDYFLESTPERIANEAARVAVVNCDAIETPAGEMEVVVGGGGGGVLLHEAVGH